MPPKRRCQMSSFVRKFIDDEALEVPGTSATFEDGDFDDEMVSYISLM